MSLVIALAIVALAYWRFKDVPLDRDWTPYAYPALHGTGYLENGHQDIKPPLIHWGFKAWLGIASELKLKWASLRMLPSISLMASVALVWTYSPSSALILALLMTAASLWAHMANTEWLTVLLLAVATAASGQAWSLPLAWLALGLLPWANQKNVLLIPVMILTLQLKGMQNALLLVTPSFAAILYLAFTGRATEFFRWTWTIPAQFGKTRTLRRNTLGHLHLLKPGLFLMLPFIATMQGPWVLVLLAMVALALLSKQVMPHHFLLLAFPISMGAQPTLMAGAAFGIAWILIEAAAWIVPANVYALTFADPGGAHYGMVLKDAEWVTRWLDENEPNEDTIWVNGMENNVYLHSGRKAWAIIVPELRETPQGLPPRIIVHCRGSVEFDYDAHGYEMVDSSPLGGLVIMRRK